MRLVERIRHTSVRTKLLAIVLLLAVVLGGAAILQVRGALLDAVGAELDKRSLSLAGDLAVRVADPLLTRNALEVRQMLRDTMANNPDVRYAFVVDGRGRLIAHTFEGGFPRMLLAVHPTRTGQPAEVLRLTSEEGALHDAVAPIVDGLAGFARVGLSESDLSASLRTVSRNLTIVVVAVGLLALLAAGVPIFTLTRRVSGLVHVVRSVGRGDLGVRANPGTPDEVGALTEAFNEMIERLRAAGEAVRAKERARTDLLQKLMTAQEEERRRMSAELHDEVGQSLTGLIVGLKVLADAPEPREQQVAYLRDLAAGTLESVRLLSRHLRPAVLDDMGLVAALERYLDDFRRAHQIEGGLQVVGDVAERLPTLVETTLYRSVQEALTNIARHSDARHFGVVLDLRRPTALAVIEDDGHGFDLSAPLSGIGLVSMHERVALVGGTVTVESRPGSGTIIYVKIPWGGEERAHAHSDRG